MLNVNKILIPFIKYEYCELKRWLQYCPATGVDDIEIILSIDTSFDKELIIELERIFIISKISKNGAKLSFLDCEMSEEESFYIKDPAKKFPYGHKSGPNMQFIKSLKKLDAKNSAVILCEVDAFPVKEGWLNDINKTLLDSNKHDVLIAGANYTGNGQIADEIAGHYNGNSIYFIGNKDFSRFLEAWDELLKIVISQFHHMAYDVVFSYVIGHKKNPRIKALINNKFDLFILWYTNRSLNLTGLLINYGAPHENSSEYILSTREFVDKYPNAVIVHGRTFSFFWSELIEVYNFLKTSRNNYLNYLLDSINENKMNVIYSNSVYTYPYIDLLSKSANDKYLIDEELINYCLRGFND